MDSLQGQFLVASPDLRDPNFARAVVLMVTHGEQGALGLILNRPTSVSVQAAWEQLSDLPCENPTKIFLGGPCQGPLMALHGRPDCSDASVVPGVFFTAKPEELTRLIDPQKEPVRFFVGYAGWGPGQLEGELEEGSWTVGPAEPESVFSYDDRLWEHTLKQIGDARLIRDLGVKHVPKKPWMN